MSGLSRRRLRLGFGRISQETNALSPLFTTVEDFRRTHFLEGEALLTACLPRGIEAPGLLRDAELSGFVRGAAEEDPGVELVPLFSAWAIPAGRLTAETFAWFRQRLRDDLHRVGPLDGLMLSLHGSLLAQGSSDPEGELLKDAREALAGVPLAATFDLHGHLTRRIVDATDILLAYRTNPHRDHAAVGRRAGRLLVRTAHGQVHPAAAWRSLPMVMGGGTTIDLLAPMRPIFQRMKAMERRAGVLSCSLFMVHLWNDAPDLGWATYALCDRDRALAEELAEELAEAAWSVRHHAPPAMPGAEEAIDQARRARLARRAGVVCMSDASDMVGAGAVGESTLLLRALLERGRGLTTFASIRDDAAVATLWERSEGSAVAVTVGGRLAPHLSAPLPVEGRLRARVAVEGLGRVVVLDLDHVQLVVTESPPLAMHPAFFRQVGLRPMSADIVVVKSLFPFRLNFLLQNRKTIYAKTRGMTDLDAWRHLDRDGPVFPREPVDDWRDADRRRRRS